MYISKKKQLIYTLKYRYQYSAVFLVKSELYSSQ